MGGCEQKKQESTRKEIFYLTNEFGLCFIDHGKLVKYFKQETQADQYFGKIALVLVWRIDLMPVFITEVQGFLFHQKFIISLS